MLLPNWTATRLEADVDADALIGCLHVALQHVHCAAPDEVIPAGIAFGLAVLDGSEVRDDPAARAVAVEMVKVKREEQRRDVVLPARIVVTGQRPRPIL